LINTNVRYIQKLQKVTLILPEWVVKKARAIAKHKEKSTSKIIGLILEDYFKNGADEL